MSEISKQPSGHPHGDLIHMPAGTSWPIVLAFGFTLLVGGLVLGLTISILGLVLVIIASVGWFRQVLPHEHAEYLPVEVQHVTIETPRRVVGRIALPATADGGRMELPLETYPVVSGIKGGIAGGIAMILPALLYGFLAHHSIWYAVNLLGGAGVAHWRNPSVADIAAFHWQGLLVAGIIHAVTCTMVGLLYGSMLPMLPGRPVLLGGIVAPLLWTGLLHSTLGIINPALDAHISWLWFVASQVAFGLVAGMVVARDSKISTSGKLPLAVRLGLESPGLMHEREEEGKH